MDINVSNDINEEETVENMLRKRITKTNQNLELKK